MVLSRLFSSTTASAQTARINSSLVSKRPLLLTSTTSISKAFGVSGTGAPLCANNLSVGLSRKPSNSYKRLGEFDINTFRKESENLQSNRRTTKPIFCKFVLPKLGHSTRRNSTCGLPAQAAPSTGAVTMNYLNTNGQATRAPTLIFGVAIWLVL